MCMKLIKYCGIHVVGGQSWSFGVSNSHTFTFHRVYSQKPFIASA